MFGTFTHRGMYDHSLLRTSLLVGLGLLAPVSLATADEIRLATPPWPGATVKSEVARQILDSLGYQATLMDASTAMILEGMVSGDIDINMALWRPSQGDMLDPRVESGELVEVTKNIEGARFKLAVPGYVWEAGIHSMEDLAAHAERFDGTFYGIEAGNVGNEIMQKAIDENTYGLSDWRVMASSVTGMLSQVASQTTHQEWVAFLGWEPHWMNVSYELRYLEDPQGIWGESSSVSTVASAAFLQERPNVAHFLEQMKVPIEVQNNWVYEFSHEDRPLEEVAREWISENPEQVAEWIEGVTTAEGGKPDEAALLGTG